MKACKLDRLKRYHILRCHQLSMVITKENGHPFPVVTLCLLFVTENIFQYFSNTNLSIITNYFENKMRSFLKNRLKIKQVALGFLSVFD